MNLSRWKITSVNSGWESCLFLSVKQSLKAKGEIVKNKIIVLIVCILASNLSSACSSIGQIVEVTRIIPQTVVVTQPVTLIVQVPITTTPAPTNTPNLLPKSTPSSKWTPDFTDAPPHILTLTPGLQVVDNKTRPDVEKFISAQYIKGYLILDYGYRSFGGKVFCGYTPIGIGNDGQSIKLYLWTTCQEYYLKKSKF